MTSLNQNQNQIDNSFIDNNMYKEPNIRKAKFIVSSDRIYTLEFDQNIEMQELMTMIQKAAHLRKNSFGLYIEGVDYTQYTEETFDSLFPNQDLVVFTLELVKNASFDETELLLYINNPCPEHDYKFLLYYCFDCGKSICSECFTNGVHKGHKIQDKCFYLLPSKYLVDKMFLNLSKKPYEDYNISVDLNEFKNQLNNVTFKQLFDMLKEAQRKCNELIDKYNSINQISLGNIRDSNRDIKISCIKALDEYKDLINIKDIINNEEVFLDFDHTYKDIGKKQNEKFQNNLLKFQELNKGISILVQNLINDICQMINDTLLKAIDNKQFDEVHQKINLKLIKPVNKDDIINQLSDKKIRIMRNKKFGRKTMFNNNYNNLVNKISKGVEHELEKNKDNNKNQNFPGRNTIIPENFNSLNNFENNNNMNNDYDMENNEQNSSDKINNFNNTLISIKDINGDMNNYNSNSTFQKPNQINNDKIAENKNNITQLLNNSNTNYSNNLVINDFDGNSNNNIISNKSQNQNNSDIQIENSNLNNNESFENSKSYDNNKCNQNAFNNKNEQNNNKLNNNNPFTQQINDISLKNSQQITDININQNGKDINNNTNEKQIKNIFDSISNDNKNNTENNNNIFKNISDKKSNATLNQFSANDISSMSDNRVLNSSNDIFQNNSSFNNDLNIINSTQAKREIINNNDINNNNQISSNENSNQKNLVSSSPFIQISSNNNNNIFNNNNIKIASPQNANNNISNSSEQNKILNITDSKYLAGLAKNCKTILEEVNESESDIKNQKGKKINIEYYLKKPYILCPIPTTNKLKIITEDLQDENIISLNFPPDSNITSFLYNCAHCNYNKKLYISGGIINPGPFQNISNYFYMIDLSNNNKSTIIELSSMLYNRSNHSMIGYNNEIYAVGGENLNSAEKYDIENDEWIEIGSMIKKRNNAMLAIHNDYLYAFFGKGDNENNYPETIERLNISNNNSSWEMILYSNPNNINTKLYGCGLYQIDELIYFLGGKYNEVANDEIFYFHLNDRRFALTDSKLIFKESFRENKLFHLGEKIVQISDGKFSGVYLTIYVQ